MERLEIGKIANGIVDDLKERAHDGHTAMSILRTAVGILNARSMTEPGWFEDKPTSSSGPTGPAA